MIRYLGPGGLFMLALWVYAVIDVISTDEILVRNLPKNMWLLLVLFAGPIGSIAWLILGRPQYAGWAPGGNASTSRPTPRPRSRPRGVEDDIGWSPPIEPAGAGAGAGVDPEVFARWEDDLARREAALRSPEDQLEVEPPPPIAAAAIAPAASAPIRPNTPAPPAPRWWSTPLDHAASDVVAGAGLVVVPGPDRVSAFDASTGALRWVSEPISDDGSGQIQIRDDAVAYWTSGDSVLLDILTGSVVDSLDEPRPSRSERQDRAAHDRWSMERTTEHLGVRTPDGRRWIIAGNDATPIPPIVNDTWLIGVAPDGRLLAVDTAVKTPVTAVQQLGFVLR